MEVKMQNKSYENVVQWGKHTEEHGMKNKVKKILFLFIMALLSVQNIFSFPNKYIEKDVSYITMKDGNEYIVQVYGDSKKQTKEGVIITI